MTTKQAIHLLHRLQDEQFDGIHGDERREALEMAVMALEGDGDMISRQAVMKEFSDFVRKSNNSDFAPTPTWNDAVSLVGSMPTIQPERKKGEWVQIQRCKGDTQPDLECPFCKHKIGWWDMGRYCAGCGAKLKRRRRMSELIDRQAAIDALDGFRCGTKAAWKVIEGLPSAQPQRKTGRWKPLYDNIWICTNCEQTEQFGVNIESTSDYCPSCGARMVKEGEEHD